MVKKVKRLLYYSFFTIVLITLLSFITSVSARNFGRDHSGMQSKYLYEVMYDYNKKYKLHYGPEPNGLSSWMVSDVIKATGETIQSMNYTPDGNHIILGDDVGMVIKINLRTKRVIWKANPYKGETNKYVRIRHINVSPNGRYVALGCRYQYYGEPKWMKILDANTGRTVNTVKIYTPNRNCYFRGKPTFLCITGVKFSKDSRYIYALFSNEKTGNFGSCAVSAERYLMKINPINGKIIWRYKVPIPAVSAPGMATIPAYNCALPAPEFDVSYLGNYIVVGGCNGNLMVLNKYNGRELFRIPSIWITIKQRNLYGGLQAAHIQFSHKNANILYLSSGHAAGTYLHTSVNLISKNYKPLTITSDYVPIIMSSPDENYLACGGNALFIWNKKTGKAIKYVNFRSGPNVKHHFEPRVNPVYQEFAVVERNRGSGYILLVHNKPVKSFYANAGSWTSTGVYVNYKLGFFLRGRGRVQLGFKSEGGFRDPDKLFNTPIWQTPFRTKYYVVNGGILYFKPETSGRFYLYGGGSTQSTIPRWGSAVNTGSSYRPQPQTRERPRPENSYNDGSSEDDK